MQEKVHFKMLMNKNAELVSTLKSMQSKMQAVIWEPCKSPKPHLYNGEYSRCQVMK